MSLVNRIFPKYICSFISILDFLFRDLDDLDELETKLNAYYAKMEKDPISKRFV